MKSFNRQDGVTRIDTTTGDTVSQVYVVDTATNEVLAVIDTDEFTTDVAVSPDGDKVYLVQNAGSNHTGVVKVVTLGSTPSSV